MKLNRIAQAVALVVVAVPPLAQAQSAPAQRVEITGSSIKRIAKEGALPVQVIRAEDLRAAGITTAEQMMDMVSANSANVDNATSRNNVFGAEQDRLTGGSSYANLRGLGPTATLVLLNGRRLTTHGMSGAAVDLNAIPMAAIDRIEILKDGASAIYGTDAIGGVINFILRKNYTGAALDITASTPMDATGGGDKKRFSVTGGFGDLDKQRFNVMASVSADRNTVLRGIDRPWATGYQPALGLSPDTTSAPHANIIGAANTALPTAGSTVGPTDTTRYTNLNLLAMLGRCQDLPFSVPLADNIRLWDKFGYTKANSTYRCATDYGRQFMLAAPMESVNYVARGQFKITDRDTAFVEVVGSRNEMLAEFTPYQFSSTSNAAANYPVGGPHYLNLKDYGAANFDPTKPIGYRWRMADWGYRTLNNTSNNVRVAAGIDGELGAYNYKVGAAASKAKGASSMVDGYADANKLVAALATGKINPFLQAGQTQTAEGQALIDSTKVTGQLFTGNTSLKQVDASLSGELMKLPAGPLEFAVGTDIRRESYEFSGSQNFACIASFTPANLALGSLASPAVMGCPGNPSSPDKTRSISALYAELIVPVMKNLEMQVAVRHDKYSQIGGTTNPKVAMRYQPMDNLVLRGSVNTGFRAPTVQQLNLGQVELALTGQFSDPEKCPTDATQCARNSLPYRAGGNPTLKPETSQQASLGVAFSPMPWLTLTADYWQVSLEDRIRSLSPTFMITNYPLFRDSFVRDVNGNVSYIQAGWVNAAESRTKGLDLSISHGMAAMGGRLATSLSATRMISHKERLIETAPLQQLVGEWTATTLYLPWKVSGSAGFKKNDWNTTLSFNHKSAYLDENMSGYTANPLPRRKVSPHTTFNLFTSYTGIKNLTLSGGFINLFDRQPPFTWHNVDGVVGAGWDPRVADPRGRTVSVALGYEFK